MELPSSPEKWRLMVKQNLYVNVQGSFICNSPKLESVQRPFNRWTVNCDISIPWSTIQLEKMNYWYMEQLGWIAREFCWVEKNIPKDYILHDSIYISFLKWKHFRNREQISGRRGLVMEVNGGGGGGVVIKEKHESLLWGTCSVSWLWG